MAKNKIERIDQEIEKTREKIAEYQEKLKTLEAQKTEAENLEIVQMVRALRMTPAQLNAMLSGGMNHGRDAVHRRMAWLSRLCGFGLGDKPLWAAGGGCLVNRTSGRYKQYAKGNLTV